MRNIKSKRMLVFLAHPDDESFAIGGTLAKYAGQGVEVILLCATRGEAGVPGRKPEEAGAIRERELENAAQELGIEVYFLGFQDGDLAYTKQETLLETVACWIDMVQPQLIVTFGPDGVSGHPDHVTISNIVTRAYDHFYNKGMLLYIHSSEATALGCGVSSPSIEDGKLLVEVDISDYKQEKVRAIQSHASQKPNLPHKVEEAIQKIPCNEVFSVARSNSYGSDPVDWFENLPERAIE